MDYLANELDSPLTPVYAVPPMYPFRARKMGIEGYVTVQFSVNEKGEISDLKVVDAKPKGIFEQEVFRCVGSWKYNPPTVNGRPVRTKWERTIEFVLE